MPEEQGTTPTDKEVCPSCGKHRSTTVSGSDKAWVFKPSKCECAVSDLAGSGSAADPAMASLEPLQTEKASESVVQSATDETSKPVDAQVESSPAGDSVVCSVESIKGQAPLNDVEDSGGWATDSILKQGKPAVTITTEEVESGSWVSLDGIGRDSVSNAPRPFKTLPVIGPSGRSPSAMESKKKIAKKEDAVALSAVRDSSGSIGSGSSSNVSAVSGSNISSSSGTGISSFNSITGVSSDDIATAGGATRQNEPGQNRSGQPEHWVPVSKKSLDTSQSQFKDDSELFGLIHQSEDAEEKEKPSTRNAIQQAFRRNRIKTLVLAIVVIALGCWFYSYVSKTEAYKQAQAKALKGIQSVTSKKNASRYQKKPKRNR